VKAQHKNVTLSLPEPLLRRFRVYAAERNQSMTSLAEVAILRLMNEDDQYEKSKRRLLERMRKGYDLGFGEKVPWTRDELHER
jgi:hypothetical protein